MNTNAAAMELIAEVARLQNGVEKNSDKACWYVWGVIRAAFVKLAATVPGCAAKFDTNPAALTPEKLAVIAAKYPKILYFTHTDSAAKVLNVNNRSVVCKVIAPDSEREAFATEAAEMMRRDFGLTVDVAPDFSALSVLTYYEPSAVAAALQDTAPTPAMVPQQEDLIAPATARNRRQPESEPSLEQEASVSSAPVRIQLDFQADYVKELDDLMRETKIVTRKDLFNNALTLFQWAAKAKRAGRIVASLDEKTGTARELVMPALENISAR